MRSPRVAPVRRFLLAFVMLAVAACSSAMEEQPTAGESTESAAEREAEIRALLDLEQALFDAENAGDLEGWISLIDENPVWLPPNEPVITGLESIRQWATPFFEHYDFYEESTDQEVEVAGGWGYIRAHWTWTVTPKAGGESITDSGKSIWILRRQPDGSWKVASAIWNSDSPSPPVIAPQQ